MKTNIYFLIISRSIPLRMKNFPDKCYRENQNTKFKFNNFLPENRAVCEIKVNRVNQYLKSIINSI